MSEENTPAQIEVLATELQPSATPLQMLTAQIAAGYISGIMARTPSHVDPVISIDNVIAKSTEWARYILGEEQE